MNSKTTAAIAVAIEDLLLVVVNWEHADYVYRGLSLNYPQPSRAAHSRYPGPPTKALKDAARRYVAAVEAAKSSENCSKKPLDNP